MQLSLLYSDCLTALNKFAIHEHFFSILAKQEGLLRIAQLEPTHFKGKGVVPQELRDRSLGSVN